MATLRDKILALEELLQELSVPLSVAMTLRMCDNRDIGKIVSQSVKEQAASARRKLADAKRLADTAKSEFDTLFRQGHDPSFVGALSFLRCTNTLQYRVASANATSVMCTNRISTLEFVNTHLDDVIDVVERYKRLCYLAETDNAENYKLSQDESMWAGNHHSI